MTPELSVGGRSDTFPQETLERKQRVGLTPVLTWPSHMPSLFRLLLFLLPVQITFNPSVSPWAQTVGTWTSLSHLLSSFLSFWWKAHLLPRVRSVQRRARLTAEAVHTLCCSSFHKSGKSFSFVLSTMVARPSAQSLFFSSSNVHDLGASFSYVNPKGKPYLLQCN